MKPTTVTSAFLSALLLAGCGVETATPSGPAAVGTSPLESAFADAAREYQVPVGLLKAIAHEETRVAVNPGVVSNSGGRGVMSVVERDDWKMLSRASQLTGVSPSRLELDARANIRGAAAVLRELADKSFRDYPALDERETGDWYQAVSLYPGIDSAPIAQEYAAQVFLRLEEGFNVQSLGGTVELQPTFTQWRRNAPAGVSRDALGDYPGQAAYVQSPNHYNGRTNYTYVVIHTMQGSYAGTKSWFLNPASQVSANYIVRSSDGQITQMVSDADGAWHAQCYNMKSIGIEHEGYVQDPGTWYTDNMYRESAKLTRWLCDRHGIPRDRSHIVGHAEVAPACNTGGHTDPGGGWNWAKYMGLVNGTTPTASTGVLTGLIYSGGNSANRVAGAVVTVAGQSATTGADGLYQFTLPPGAYTVSVAKGGFSAASVARTLTAGATVWGSMEINAAAATGTLRGKVYVYNAAAPTDLSVAIAGAVVTAGGQSQTVGADGNFVFTLPPGTYTVQASKAGYAANSLSRMVTAGATIWGSVGLTGNAAPDQQAPTVSVSFPADHAQLDVAVLDVKGTASDDRGAVASVKLSVNGGQSTDVPVTAGVFTMQVKLKPGTNTLKVTATDAAGNTGAGESSATFNAGVAGFVYAADDEAARVQGVSLELRESSTGAVVATATADATGSYALPALVVPADYLVVARANGFISHSETVSVPDDKRLTLNLSLTAGSEIAGSASLTFSEPLEGSTITTDAVTLYGVAQGFELLSLTVNGVPGELLGAGGFSATVPLVEGANTLQALATGLNGESVSATLHLTRKSSATGKSPATEPAKGGCSATGGLELLGLLALVPGLRLRRRAR